MWNIQRPSFGFVLTLSGQLEATEVEKFGTACKAELAKPLPDAWGVVVDMRELTAMPPASADALVSVQKAFKARGMTRSVVVLKDAVTTMQQRRLARTSGIDAWERYINAASVAEWQAVAKRWVVNGEEPPL